MKTLPAFPVHEIALDLIEHALGASLAIVDGDHDNPVVVGAEFTIPQLLAFYAGQSETDVVPVVDSDGYEVPGWVEAAGPSYHRNDIIRALIGEVRRLRGMTP